MKAIFGLFEKDAVATDAEAQRPFVNSAKRLHMASAGSA